MFASLIWLGGSKLFKPVTKHDGHPLDHLDQAVVEPGGVSLEQQHNGVGMVNGARQGRHHLFHQNLVIAICVSESRGIHNLEQIFEKEYEIRLTVKFCPFPNQGPKPYVVAFVQESMSLHTFKKYFL